MTLTCPACHTPLYPRLAKRTDNGWACADDLGCTVVEARLTGETLPAVIARLYTDGASIRDLQEATGLSNRQVRRHLATTGTPTRGVGRRAAVTHDPIEESEDIAYDGEWVRRGMVWMPARPRQRKAA